MKSILITSTMVPTQHREVRAYYVIKELSKHYKVTLLVTPSKEDKVKDLGELRRFCEVIIPEDLSKIFSEMTKNQYKKHYSKTKYLKRFGNLPLKSEITSRHYYFHLKFKKEIEKLLAKRHFDYIQIEQFYVGPVLEDIKTKAKKILVFHNVHSHMKNSFWEKIKMRKEEKNMIKHYDLVICCSEIDKERLKKLGHNKILVVPNGVDTNYFKKVSFSKKNILSLLFVGYIYYEPNYKGLKYFFSKIYPLLDKNIQINIIGDYDEKMFEKEGRLENVKFCGLIKDIRPFFKNSIFICPLLDGGGTRLKILTSFAAGSPVVSTGKGAEGIEYTNGKDILIADSATKFAKSINTLMNNKELYNRIRNNARELAEKKYDWKEITKQYVYHLDNLK